MASKNREEVFGFCTNSRRWLVLMDFSMRYPRTCIYNGECDRCDYFRERKPSSYLLQKMKILESFG